MVNEFQEYQGEYMPDRDNINQISKVNEQAKIEGISEDEKFRETKYYPIVETWNYPELGARTKIRKKFGGTWFVCIVEQRAEKSLGMWAQLSLGIDTIINRMLIHAHQLQVLGVLNSYWKVDDLQISEEDRVKDLVSPINKSGQLEDEIQNF